MVLGESGHVGARGRDLVEIGREIRYGLVAGGIADFGGLLIILALLAMWIGILRYPGTPGVLVISSPESRVPQ